MMADSLPTGPPDPERMRTREKALRDVYVRDTDTISVCCYVSLCYTTCNMSFLYHTTYSMPSNTYYV